MRKFLLFPVILALCAADVDAFGAARRGGTPATGAKAAPTATAARAGKTQGTVVAPKTGANTGAKPTAARAGKKQGTVAAPKTGANTGAKPTAARAGSKQKVVNMGTKVAAATENTAVSQECQTAYYGCMDAFCMLDNASGGRCQCSDRNKDLNAVLDEIMKLDQQTLLMATEGVERIQMGESVDEIMARVNNAMKGVSKADGTPEIPKEGTSSTTKRTTQTLDLSAWKTNSLFDDDDDDDDVFDEDEKKAKKAKAQISGGDFSNKNGDDLQIAASELCGKQMPAQCLDSVSFLQMAYGQKIRSDCTAYENGLKQQRSASQEKLQAAQKALRDAALEAFQNENKYDFGQCVTEVKKCLQTTAECGEDFSGCVADTAILEALYSKKADVNKVATTPIKTGTTTITISSATYDIINGKQRMCESVTKQCVKANANNAVWKQVIVNLAPSLYTAEYTAASNNRMNCISTVASCVQKSCETTFGEDAVQYEACISDPKSIDNYCKLEYAKCGDMAASGSAKSYIISKLYAMRVDACSDTFKKCLTKEDNCGEDYGNCLGLDTDSIVDMCPEDSINYMCKDRGSKESVRTYLTKIAQGIALNIDNKFATACQNAVEAARGRVCGSVSTEESSEEDETEVLACPNMNVDTRLLDNTMRVVYRDNNAGKFQNSGEDISKIIHANYRGLWFSKISSLQKELARLKNMKYYNSIDEFIGAQGITTDLNAAPAKSITRVLALEPVILGAMGGILNVQFDETGNGGKGAVEVADKEGGDSKTGDTASTATDRGAKGENSEEGEAAEPYSIGTYFYVTTADYKKYAAIEGNDGDIEEMLTQMSRKYKEMIDQIEIDTTIDSCVNGKTFSAISTRKQNNKTKGETRFGRAEGRFPNLTKSTHMMLSGQIIDTVLEKYIGNASAAQKQLVDAYSEITTKYVDLMNEAQLDAANEKQCKAKHVAGDFARRGGHKSTYKVEPKYDFDTNQCDLKRSDYSCKDYVTGSSWHRAFGPTPGCRDWGTPTVTNTSEQMATLKKK